MTIKCPECKKRGLYETKDEDGYTEKICYVCGYYENDSEGYRLNPELEKSLFREYFPRQVKWRPSADLDGRWNQPKSRRSPRREPF